MSSPNVRESVGFGNKKTAKTIIPSAVGNSAKKASASPLKQVTFQVQAKPGSKVYLVGDFNKWDCLKKELLDKDGNGLYQGEIALKPGTYEYKFHINDMWCIDPENHNFRPNKMGTLNSVIVVE